MSSTMPADSGAEQRIYIAQWTCWWAAALIACELIVFILGVMGPRHMIVALSRALLPAIVLAVAVPALIVALFVFAGVLIGKRRRDGAILAIGLLVWQGAGAVVRPPLPRFAGVRIALGVACVVAIALIVRAWRDLSSAQHPG